MNCPQCKSELPKGASACPVCGTTVFDREKSRLRRFVILGVVLAVVIAAVVLIISLENPVEACMDAFLNNRFDEASAIYMRDIQGNPRRVAEITPLIEQRIDEVVGIYRQDDGKYEEIRGILSGMMTFPILQPQIQQGVYFVDSLHDSRTAYQNAAVLLEEGYYEAALLELDRVIPEDDNYAQAQKDKERCASLRDAYNAEVKKVRDGQAAFVSLCRVMDASGGKQLSIRCTNNDAARSITAVAFAYTLTDESGTNLKYVDVEGPIYHGSYSGRIHPNKQSGEKDILLNLNQDVTGVYPVKSSGCVKTVTFDSGTVWTNPYYKYWVKSVLTREEYKKYQESMGINGDPAATPTPAPES